MTNWYVIQVITGQEKKTLKAIKEMVNNEVLVDVFIPMIERTKKYRGEWHSVNEPLFPGYLFLVSDDIPNLYQELKKVPKLTKLLGTDKDEIYPLTKKEVAFIEKIAKNDYIIDLSIGLIEGDKIKVIQGPLKNREGLIKKIDRHKRVAYIDLEFFNQVIRTKVGLEIIKKD